MTCSSSALKFLKEESCSVEKNTCYENIGPRLFALPFCTVFQATLKKPGEFLGFPEGKRGADFTIQYLQQFHIMALHELQEVCMQARTCKLVTGVGPVVFHLPCRLLSLEHLSGVQRTPSALALSAVH